MSRAFWDERFGAEEYAYGKAPNDFLRESAHLIPEGPILALAEGEGRNAVFLAERGHAVVAVDQSKEGLKKARQLAEERGVSLELIARDLAELEFGEKEHERYAGIVSIFAHLPPSLRREVHARVVRSLLPGGVFILEAYAPAQLAYGTGGPKDPALLASLDELRAELSGLEFEIAREVVREISEGKFHQGKSATVQIVAKKPSSLAR